jgi:flagellar hook assembly protein FlgD
MKSHGARTASWNGTNTSRAPVADGGYKVCFEVEDGAQQYQCVDFSKSRSAQTLMPADTGGFTARKLTYTP